MLSVPDIESTGRVLRDVLGMEHARTYADGAETRVYAMNGGGESARELHLRADPGLPRAVSGSGAVHHLALRTPDQAGYDFWAARLRQMRMPSSGPVDRFYFKSLYFREPNGILFEIATDGPGFAVDEPADRLGETLSLPPFLEGRRAAIEAGLKPLAV